MRRPLMPVLSADQAATAGWEGLLAGRAEVLIDLPTRIGLQTLRLLPWQLIVRTTPTSPNRAR